MRYIITVQGSRVTSGYVLAAAGEREGEREGGGVQTDRQTDRDRQTETERNIETETGRGRHPHTRGGGGGGGGLFRLKNSHYRCILVDNLSPEGDIIYFHLSYL